MIDSFDAIKAFDIVTQTNDSFSFERYGEAEWIKCIVFLQSEGYTPEMVIAILRSKHMRWAADNGCADYRWFKEYVNTKHGNQETGKWYIDEMLREELGFEVFHGQG